MVNLHRLALKTYMSSSSRSLSLSLALGDSLFTLSSECTRWKASSLSESELSVSTLTCFVLNDNGICPLYEKMSSRFCRFLNSFRLGGRLTAGSVFWSSCSDIVQQKLHDTSQELKKNWQRFLENLKNRAKRSTSCSCCSLFDTVPSNQAITLVTTPLL